MKFYYHYDILLASFAITFDMIFVNNKLLCSQTGLITGVEQKLLGGKCLQFNDNA